MESINFGKSKKLDNVCYDIRGKALEKSVEMERNGDKILKLNTGNPGAFGFNGPESILESVKKNMDKSVGYSNSQGILEARKYIAKDLNKKNIFNFTLDDIYLGNGVSELIQISMNAFLDNNDEILIPAPDYPLWTACVSLSGGKPVHYICDESSDWFPDLADIEKKINKKTKGIVVINPNNPTGAVYPKEILEKIVKLAEKYNLVIFADEIYDKILYDDAKHIAIASLTDNFVVTFNGLSKSYRICGFRVGWMVLTGNKKIAKDYIDGINILSNMRLCSNVPGQYAIKPALTGHQTIYDLTKQGGRLYEQREYCYNTLIDIPGITCVKPMGALYLFPKVDVKKFNITNDVKLIYDILVSTKILVVQGRGFNISTNDHFRVVFLPDIKKLKDVLGSLKDFFKDYRQK